MRPMAQGRDVKIKLVFSTVNTVTAMVEIRREELLAKESIGNEDVCTCSLLILKRGVMTRRDQASLDSLSTAVRKQRPYGCVATCNFELGSDVNMITDLEQARLLRLNTVISR